MHELHARKLSDLFVDRRMEIELTFFWGLSITISQSDPDSLDVYVGRNWPIAGKSINTNCEPFVQMSESIGVYLMTCDKLKIRNTHRYTTPLMSDQLSKLYQTDQEWCEMRVELELDYIGTTHDALCIRFQTFSIVLYWLNTSRSFGSVCGCSVCCTPHETQLCANS